MSRHAFLHGTQESLAAGFACGFLGIVITIIALNKGLTALQILFMNGLMYAGAAELFLLGHIQAHECYLSSLLLTTLVICSRYMLMGFSLKPTINQPLLRATPGLFLLMDENWALTMLAKHHYHQDRKLLFCYYLGAGITCYVAWVIGTLLALVFQRYAIMIPYQPCEFMLYGLFLSMLVMIWKAHRAVVAWGVTLVAGITCYHYLSGSYYILISALSGSILGAYYELRHKN